VNADCPGALGEPDTGSFANAETGFRLCSVCAAPSSRVFLHVCLPGLGHEPSRLAHLFRNGAFHACGGIMSGLIRRVGSVAMDVAGKWVRLAGRVRPTVLLVLTGALIALGASMAGAQTALAPRDIHPVWATAGSSRVVAVNANGEVAGSANVLDDGGAPTPTGSIGSKGSTPSTWARERCTESTTAA
jgi:hypothetical protein